MDDLEGNRPALHELFARDPLGEQLGFRLEGWGGGWARVAWTPADDDRNFMGSVHGGALVALGDAVLSFAANSWGRHAVAIAVDTQFLRAVRPGSAVIAVGREVHRTRRTGHYTVDLRDPDDALVAAFRGVVHRADGWHLGAEAWSDEWRGTH